MTPRRTATGGYSPPKRRHVTSRRYRLASCSGDREGLAWTNRRRRAVKATAQSRAGLRRRDAKSEPGLDRVVKIVALAFVGVLFAAFVGGCLYTWATAPSPAETASTEAPVSNPAPGNSPVSPIAPAGQTKAVLDSFVDAMIEWQYSFEPIYDDITTGTLALEQFGVRTEAARARLHTSLAAMKAAIPADIDPALGDILNELVGPLPTRRPGIDDLAAAAKASDRAASGVALDKWGAGLERRAACHRTIYSGGSAVSDASRTSGVGSVAAG